MKTRIYRLIPTSSNIQLLHCLLTSEICRHTTKIQQERGERSWPIRQLMITRHVKRHGAHVFTVNGVSDKEVVLAGAA